MASMLRPYPTSGDPRQQVKGHPVQQHWSHGCCVPWCEAPVLAFNPLWSITSHAAFSIYTVSITGSTTNHISTSIHSTGTTSVRSFHPCFSRTGGCRGAAGGRVAAGAQTRTEEAFWTRGETSPRSQEPVQLPRLEPLLLEGELDD